MSFLPLPFFPTGLKGMNFDHDFSYSFPLFSSLLKKSENKNENELAKIVIKIHAFQTSPSFLPVNLIDHKVPPFVRQCHYTREFIID